MLGLKLGADDYVTKPYSLRELAARLETVIRRAMRYWRRSLDEIREEGSVRIDLQRRRVYVRQREVVLTRKEFDLLALLIAEPGKVVTRHAIMQAVWGQDDPGHATLGVHMTTLRKKLGVPGVIETVRGVGFRFVPDRGASPRMRRLGAYGVEDPQDGDALGERHDR